MNKLLNLYITITQRKPPGIVTGFDVWENNGEGLTIAFFILEGHHHFFEIIETQDKLTIAKVLVENTGQFRLSEDRGGWRVELWEAPFTY